MIGKLCQNKKYSRNFQYIEYDIQNLIELPSAVFGEKRTQKLSPGLIKDQHGLFYFLAVHCLVLQDSTNTVIYVRVQ